MKKMETIEVYLCDVEKCRKQTDMKCARCGKDICRDHRRDISAEVADGRFHKIEMFCPSCIVLAEEAVMSLVTKTGEQMNCIHGTPFPKYCSYCQMEEFYRDMNRVFDMIARQEE